MSIACVAVDDEPLALELVTGYINKTPFLNLAGTFYNPVEALAMIAKESVPLVFLDINMPDLSGMELSRLLPQGTRVIFTTAYEEYALESYRVAALDYLVKPFGYSDFLVSAQRAQSYFQTSAGEEQQDYLFVKADYKLHKVTFAEIIYVENIKDYVRIYLADGRNLMSLMSLKSLVEKLPAEMFMQVHRSYVVNLNAVQMVERSRIVFGKRYVPISDSYKESFNRFLKSKD